MTDESPETNPDPEAPILAPGLAKALAQWKKSNQTPEGGGEGAQIH